MGNDYEVLLENEPCGDFFNITVKDCIAMKLADIRYRIESIGKTLPDFLEDFDVADEDIII